jgi:hypothetical protein
MKVQMREISIFWILKPLQALEIRFKPWFILKKTIDNLMTLNK